MPTLSRRTAVAFALCVAATLPAQAQTAAYPTKPIRMVVTFPPGGSTDAVVRMLVPRLNDKLGQQVVVDNRPGAGGNIGLTVVAKAAPGDGYTLGVGAAGALAANSSLYAQMPFDPQKDLKPVSMLAAIPFVIIGNPSVAAKTQKELVALAKSQPGKLSIAHGGNGTAMHLSAALFAQMADVKLVEVPYRGSGPAALDVLAGQPVITVRPGYGIRPLIDGTAASAGVVLDVVNEVSFLSTALWMTASGVAASIMPSAFARYSRQAGDGALVVKTLTAPKVSRDIFVVTRRGRSLPPAGQALIEVIREEMTRARA